MVDTHLSDVLRTHYAQFVGVLVVQQHVRQERDDVHRERQALGRVDDQQVEQGRQLRQQRHHVLVRDRIGAALQEERVHARERRGPELDGQLVHLVPGVGPVERQPAEDPGQQPGREQELVLVVGLEQRHGQPEQLAEHGELVVLRGRVTEHFQILLVAVDLAAGPAVVGGRPARGFRGRGLLRERVRGLPGVVRHGVAGAPEVRRRRLVEARRWHAPVVDRCPVRRGPLLSSLRHHWAGVFVVQVRRRFENVPGHVQRPEVRFQRVYGRLQGQQELRHVALRKIEWKKHRLCEVYSPVTGSKSNKLLVGKPIGLTFGSVYYEPGTDL